MKKVLKEAVSHLMSGISYMIPLLIGGSLLMAIANLIALSMGITTLNRMADSTGFVQVLYRMYTIGNSGISLMNIALATFIAFSIAGKPAVGAGLIGGYFATNSGMGFIGATVAGFVAGYVTRWAVKNIKLKGAAKNVIPMILYPFLATFAVAVVLGLILKNPLAAMNMALTNWMKNLLETSTSKYLLAAVIGAMMASDMGGPINKACSAACIALASQGIFLPSIYMMCAISIPSFGYAFATALGKKKFNDELKAAGAGCWALGFLGITEGAIPFTLLKPQILIPANMIGGAIGSCICVLLGVDVITPAGVSGVMMAIMLKNGWAYVLGMAVGALVIAAIALLFVDFNAQTDTDDENAIDDVEIRFE